MHERFPVQKRDHETLAHTLPPSLKLVVSLTCTTASVCDCTAMKDQIERYLLPTNDMKIAIDRNTKQDEDLSLVLKQIDKEKRVTLRQLASKQDAFKKQILKRRETLPKHFIVQRSFEQANVQSRDRPHLDEMVQQARRLRRSWSCEEPIRASKIHLPVALTKRHSLTVSSLPGVECGDELSLKRTSPRRMKNPLSSSNENYRQLEKEDKSLNENYKMVANHSYTKSPNYTAQNLIRQGRHSDAAFPGLNINNKSPRLPHRRRVTIHNLMEPSIENDVESVIILRENFRKY